MRTVAIIQARMGSTRLPGKVLADLCGAPMLWHIVERVKRAKFVDEVVVAIPASVGIDYVLESYLREKGINIYEDKNRKDNDLIGRYFWAAQAFYADLIVRICADNPFVDPAEIDRAIKYYNLMPSNFVSNMHQHKQSAMKFNYLNGYPDGIGCEVFSMSRLKWMNEYVTRPDYREHPHKIFHDEGVIESPPCPVELLRPDLRLDVNTQIDLDYVRSIYGIVYSANPQFTTKEVIDAIDAHHLAQREIST